MAYARPPNKTRLITTSRINPWGVMRIVQPTRRFRGREGRGELDDAGEVLMLIDLFYPMPGSWESIHLVFKTGPIKLVVYSSLCQQIGVGDLLDNSPLLDDNDPVCTDDRGEAVCDDK